MLSRCIKGSIIVGYISYSPRQLRDFQAKVKYIDIVEGRRRFCPSIIFLIKIFFRIGSEQMFLRGSFQNCCINFASCILQNVFIFRHFKF